MRALHVDEILGPQPLDRFEAFLEAFAEAGARHPERLELDIAVTDAAAEHQLAAGHDVQGRQLLGHVERLCNGNSTRPQISRSRGAIAAA